MNDHGVGTPKPQDHGRPPKAHWSRHIYTRTNWLLRRLLTSRWHGWASGKLLLLRITGRRSGRTYSIAVGYRQHSEDVLDVLVSDAANRTWWRNFIGGGPVEVVLRGQSRTGTALVHRPTAPEFKEIADRAMYRLLGPDGVRRIFGIEDFDRAVGLQPADLERLRDFAVAVAIRLDPDPGP